MLTLTFLGVGSAFSKRNDHSNALIEAWQRGPDHQRWHASSGRGTIGRERELRSAPTVQARGKVTDPLLGFALCRSEPWKTASGPD